MFTSENNGASVRFGRAGSCGRTFVVRPPPDRELAASWVQVHGTLAVVLVVVVAGHVLAALYHQFVQKDGTLQRMFTWRAPGK